MAFMYMARINDVMEQDNMYSVSFGLVPQKHTDGLITGQTRSRPTPIFAM